MAREFDELRTRLPPSLNSGNMIRQEPSMMDAIGGEENIGGAAGTMPMPELFNTIDRILRQRRRDQGVPGPGSSLGPVRMAGDVLTPYAAGTPRGDEAMRRRLETPGFWQGSRGAGSINFYGGSRRNPTIDLLEVLQFPGGGPFPTRARGGKVERDKPYVVGEEGPEKFVPDRTRVAQADFVPPEGFREIDPVIPEGFKEITAPNAPAPTAGRLIPEPPTPTPPAPTAGTSQPLDLETMSPAERAAYRTRQAQIPAQGRQEGTVTRFIERAAPEAYQALDQQVEDALRSGDPGRIAEQAMLLAPTSPAYRTGRAIAATRAPQEAAQVETGVMSIPRAAQSGAAGVAPAVAATPVGGGPIRRAAEAATAELQTAGRAAPTRPLAEGAEPTAQTTAGRHVRSGIEQATMRALANNQTVSPRITRLLNQSDEDIVGSLVKMAGNVKSGADANTLAQIRRMVPEAQRPEVQSAIITRISGKGGEFDPKGFATAYGNLSERGKNLLFGERGSQLRYHLDSIDAVSRRAPTWQRFEKGRATLGTRAGIAAQAATLAPAAVGAFTGAGGVWETPLTVLGTIVPLNLLARSLARPATAAPLAQWSRAYEGLIRSGGAAPGAVAAFKLATTNLSNSMGEDFTWTDFFRESRKGTLGPAQRALESVLPEE